MKVKDLLKIEYYNFYIIVQEPGKVYTDEFNSNTLDEERMKKCAERKVWDIQFGITTEKNRYEIDKLWCW